MTTRRTFEQGSQERLGWGPARTRVAAGTSVRVSLSARKALRLGWGCWGRRGPGGVRSGQGHRSLLFRIRGQTSGDSTGRPGQGCGVKSQQLRGQPAGTFPGSGDQAPERHARASRPRLIRGGTEGPRCQAAGAWASDPEGRPVGSRPLPGRHRARSGGSAPPVTGRTTRAALRPERGSLSSRAWCARSGHASLGVGQGLLGQCGSGRIS